ncbi:hypothetical protein F5ESL0262_04685, partial [Lactobacillus sp. ESL0262]
MGLKIGKIKKEARSEVNPLDWTKIQLEGFTMVKFTVKQKLQALNLLKEGYSSCSVAQMIGTGSHQLIDT